VKVTPFKTMDFLPVLLYITEIGPVPLAVAGVAPAPKFQVPATGVVNIISALVHPWLSTLIMGGLPGTDVMFD
jgi:hypothetical protein